MSNKLFISSILLTNPHLKCNKSTLCSQLSLKPAILHCSLANNDASILLKFKSYYAMPLLESLQCFFTLFRLSMTFFCYCFGTVIFSLGPLYLSHIGHFASGDLCICRSQFLDSSAPNVHVTFSFTSFKYHFLIETFPDHASKIATLLPHTYIPNSLLCFIIGLITCHKYTI